MYQPPHSNPPLPHSTGRLSNAAHTGLVSSPDDIHFAEVGLTYERATNPKGHDLYPSYCMMVRLLELSIEDYRLSASQQLKDAEVRFWRDSDLFVYYGQLVCDLELELFGREFTLDDLRRGAEGQMGLSRGSLSPQQPNTFCENQQVSCRLKGRFAYIRHTVGHVPDADADRRFRPWAPAHHRNTAEHVASPPATVPLFAIA